MDGFTFKFAWADAVEGLLTEERLEFYEGVIAIARGEDYTSSNPLVNLALLFVKQDITREMEHGKEVSEKRRQARLGKQKEQLISKNHLITKETIDIKEEEQFIVPLSATVPHVIPSKGKRSPKAVADYDAFLAGIDDEQMRAVFSEWLAYKKERHETYTPRGLKACYTSLLNLSGNNVDMAMNIVVFSMGNNYQGLIVPKQPQFSVMPEQQSRVEGIYNTVNKAKERILQMAQEGLL